MDTLKQSSQGHRQTETKKNDVYGICLSSFCRGFWFYLFCSLSQPKFKILFFSPGLTTAQDPLVLLSTTRTPNPHLRKADIECDYTNICCGFSPEKCKGFQPDKEKELVDYLSRKNTEKRQMKVRLCFKLQCKHHMIINQSKVVLLSRQQLIANNRNPHLSYIFKPSIYILSSRWCNRENKL